MFMNFSIIIVLDIAPAWRERAGVMCFILESNATNFLAA